MIIDNGKNYIISQLHEQELRLHVIFTWIKFADIARGQLGWQVYPIKRNVHVPQVYLFVIYYTGALNILRYPTDINPEFHSAK